MSDNDWIIKVNDLSIHYGNYCALRNINFFCKRGEFVAIVGKSGTGKSSFLNALAGFVNFSGELIIPNNIGYIFQNYSLFPWMMVKNNIKFGLDNYQKADRNRIAKKMLAKIEMIDYAKKYPSELSGGQVQRVALARALAPNPDILLMDEPYGALDHHTRDKMQSWLLSIWKESLNTVLFVTHYIEEAIFLADRIIIVNNKSFIKEIDVPFSRPRSQDIRFSDRYLDIKHVVLDFMENDV